MSEKTIKSKFNQINDDFQDVQQIHHEINGLFEDKIWELRQISEESVDKFLKEYSDQISDLERAESDIYEAEGWLEQIGEIVDLSDRIDEMSEDDEETFEQAEVDIVNEKLEQAQDVVDNARRCLSCRGFFNRDFNKFTDAIGYNY